VVVRSRNDSSLQAPNADHTALRIESLFLILEFASREGLWFPSLTSKGGLLIRSRTLCSIPLYPLCFRISRVVQVVPIGLRRIFSMLAPRSFKNALRRRGSHWLIGLIVHWQSSTEKFNIVDQRSRHVPKPVLLECYGRSGRSSPDRNLES